ncbi:MAG TPA: arylesterase [Dongiaceae bacterium]|nr:arylesterase [Dongiaceae bacterium]
MADQPVKLLAFGDSLTAGYGLSEAEGFTAQLAAALQKMGRQVQVINGGVSGDTTSGGLARIDWALADQPQVMLLELGGNDMLRGLAPQITETNLDQIIAKAQQAQVTILLVGMRAAPNLGADYQKQFDGLYPALAKTHNLLFYPFMLDGVAANPDLLQGDGIHPNAKGVGIIVTRMMPSILQALDKVQKPAG